MRFFTSLLVVSALSCSLAVFAYGRPVDYVDPAIGGQGLLLEPTRPTVHLPNSMVRVYPVRKDQLDDQIASFPLTIISHRLGELFWLMPSNGGGGGEWDRPLANDAEKESPYYYSTRFEEKIGRAHV